MSGFPVVAALMCTEVHDQLIVHIDSFIDALHKLLKVRWWGMLLCLLRPAAHHAACCVAPDAAANHHPRASPPLAHRSLFAGPPHRVDGAALPVPRDRLLHPPHVAQERRGCALGAAWLLPVLPDAQLTS